MTRIFLSYARDDDEPFVRRLYEELKHAGGRDGLLFDVWFDRVSMPSRLLTFHQEIRDAIDARDRVILVVGPKAIASDYVTQEWQFAYFAANKCVNPIVRLDGRDANANRVDGYTLIPEDLRLLHAEDFRDDAQFAVHLDNLIRQLSEPLSPVGKLVAVPELPPTYRAQPERLKALRDLLLIDLQKPVVVTGAAARVGVQGMGGIGKSVLVNALAHHPQVRRAFQDGIYWITVGQQPRLEELQRQLAVALGGDGHFDNRHAGKEQLRQLLADRSALLILDDVWERDHADAFNVASARSRILLTTRDAGLVTALAARENHYRVELPTLAEAQTIVGSAAEVPPDQLPSEAAAIIEECGRLPLALALCGGMVQGGCAWTSVLAALQEHDLEYLSNEHPDEAQHQNAWKAMDISLRVLPADEQQRFAELAVFGVDTGAPDAAVATLWQHTAGLSSRQTDALLAKFTRRSLVQRPSAAGSRAIARVDLHDLLHHFATGMAVREFGSITALHQLLLDAYRAKCPDGWPSGPHDGFFLQNLGAHLLGAGRIGDLVELHLNLRWLETKNEAGLAFDLAVEFVEVINALPVEDPKRHLLELLHEAIRRDIHFIARHAQDYPQGLFQCLWNSCWWYDCPEVQAYYVGSSSDECNEAATRNRLELKLHPLLEGWLEEKRNRHPGFVWLRTRRPTSTALGSAQQSVFRGHSDIVFSVAYSPDGNRIASGSGDNTVRLWDVASGSEILCLCGHTNGVRAVAFSPSGRRIASASQDETIRLWDASTGAELSCLRGHSGGVRTVAFSPDGRLIASGAEDCTIRIWDADAGYQQQCFTHQQAVASVAFLPDGQHIVSGSDDATVRLWDLAGGERRRLSGHQYWVTCAMPSPDGALIASGGDTSIRIWDVLAGRERHRWQGHSDWVLSVAWSSDGSHLVSGGYDRSLRLWNLSQPGNSICLGYHSDWIRSVAFSPNARACASASADCTLKVWDTTIQLVRTQVDNHAAGIRAVAYSPDGRWIATGADDASLRIWSGKTGTVFRVLAGHEASVCLACFSGDSTQLFSGSVDGHVCLWDLTGGVLLASAKLGGAAKRATFLPNGSVVVRLQDASSFMWDIAEGSLAASACSDAMAVPQTRSGASSRLPQALSKVSETVIVNVEDHGPIAWFPARLRPIAPAWDEAMWAGADGAHLQVIALEGQPKTIPSKPTCVEKLPSAPDGFLQDALDRAHGIALVTDLAGVISHVSRTRSMIPYCLDGGWRKEHRQVHPWALINDLVQMITKWFPNNIELRTECAADLPFVAGDSTQLLQALLNLVTNARDAMPHGGVLAIRASRCVSEEPAAAHPVEQQRGDQILLSIRDTGLGIPSEIIPHIFEPFFTAKGKGTGLGLAVVKTILEQHHGSINVSSAVGTGTEFRILLPVADQDARMEASESSFELFAQLGLRNNLRQIVNSWRADQLLRENLVTLLDSPQAIQESLIWYGMRINIAPQAGQALLLVCYQGGAAPRHQPGSGAEVPTENPCQISDMNLACELYRKTVPVVAHCDLLLCSQMGPVEVQEWSRAIHQSAGRLLSLVQDVLPWTGLSRTNQAPEVMSRNSVDPKLEHSADMLRFLAGVAHECNNSMSVLLGYTELLARRMVPNDSHRFLIDALERSTYNLQECLRAILAAMVRERNVRQDHEQ